MVPGAGIVLASPWDDGRPNHTHGSYRYCKNCHFVKCLVVVVVVVVVGPLVLLRLALAVQVRRAVVVIVDCILVPGRGPGRGVPVFAWHDRRLVRWRH